MPSRKRTSADPDDLSLEMKRLCLPRSERSSTKEASYYLSSPMVYLEHSLLGTILGTLPSEIRNEIYFHVLVSSSQQGSQGPATSGPLKESQTHTSLTQRSPTLPGLPSKPDLAILLTCRQIYQEASYVLYTHTSLHFANGPDLLEFLKSVGPMNRERLISLHLEGQVIDWGRMNKRSIRDPNPKSNQAAKLLRYCNHLKKLHLHVGYGEEAVYLCFLEEILPGCLLTFEVVDDFNWTAYATGQIQSSFLNKDWITVRSKKWVPQMYDWADTDKTTKRWIEVTITRGSRVDAQGQRLFVR